MNQQDLLQIVQRRGYSARIQGEEVLLETCLFCGNDRYNLELNSNKGVYSCWACPASGPLQALLRDRFNHDARVSVNLDTDDPSTTRSESITFGHGFRSAAEIPSAVAWLGRRYVTERDIRKYDLKVCVDDEHEHHGRITFPLRNYWTGDFVGYNSRDYAGLGKPKYLIELRQKVPVGYRTSENNMVHVAVEGIFDAIRVHQAGYNSLCLLGSGSNALFTEWAATVPKREEIVLMLDGDEVGVKRAEALKHITATVREEPTVLTLPEDTDPADIPPDLMKVYLERKL